ncbi:MAG: hypothetical protein PVG97_04170 [Syntrophobacterales bacterium]
MSVFRSQDMVSLTPDPHILLLHQRSSIDVHNHVLVAVGLIIRPAALMQRSPFDNDGGAAPWQCGHVNRCSADCPPRCTARDTGYTDRRQGSADTRLGFRLWEYPAVEQTVRQKVGAK